MVPGATCRACGGFKVLGGARVQGDVAKSPNISLNRCTLNMPCTRHPAPERQRSYVGM